LFSRRIEAIFGKLSRHSGLSTTAGLSRFTWRQYVHIHCPNISDIYVDGLCTVYYSI